MLEARRDKEHGATNQIFAEKIDKNHVATNDKNQETEAKNASKDNILKGTIIAAGTMPSENDQKKMVFFAEIKTEDGVQTVKGNALKASLIANRIEIEDEILLEKNKNNVAGWSATLVRTSEQKKLDNAIATGNKETIKGMQEEIIKDQFKRIKYAVEDYLETQKGLAQNDLIKHESKSKNITEVQTNQKEQGGYQIDVLPSLKRGDSYGAHDGAKLR